ncbi:Fatty acyl-CoA reductase [Tritonibacter multivorans]|uniref:Fatty acyl-CoA reductase n=1 Tax=Tritonibacter multivorans TaxID=928856 RepID=A0A0P1G419_9RHOB|nr:SDR family NAD(P)-dependent oxidoreductase [Tritonibacter multivorans]MDA7421918.1 SDR family NAD(P)-dependent oxidoreductase [Tritonibacter multivorans]CUH76591.1 Fatty acyl-CoA reductase [Tritonibacter multivorans]SFD47693.1 short chain dehydrogenase [Tritonibacter multivorans]
MSKTILITGSTDGIGLLTAKMLAAQGHKVLLHGRSQTKLDAAIQEVGGATEGFIADFSKLGDVTALADALLARGGQIDVLINNAGVYKTPQTRSAEGLDLRFVVNTLAPWVLTQRLLPVIPAAGRVLNLSSAAQARVDLEALSGQKALDDFEAYAQSKLAITIWSQELAASRPDGPVVIAVNPGSLLASKMVKDGFGVAGNDLRIGADILCRLSLDEDFAGASGKYFDNDAGRFAAPHPAAQNAEHRQQVTEAIDRIAKSLV